MSKDLWVESTKSVPVMRQIGHRTLSSAISEQIRQEILSGKHPAGSQLRQDALAASFGVSRIPVREALIQLESEGLVQILPHKGAIVTPLVLDEINDVFDLRVMLEVRLLKAACPKMTAETFVKLDAIQDSFAAAIASNDIRRWGELNAEFHLALYADANLPRSLQFVTGLLQTSDRYTRLQLSSKEALLRAQSEHKKLIKLCKDGRTKDACALLVSHIEAVRADLVQIISAL